jgi:hypothetical protein
MFRRILSPFHLRIKNVNKYSTNEYNKYSTNEYNKYYTNEYNKYSTYEYNKYIGKTLTKKQFTNKFPDYIPYKVIRADMRHYDYTYKLGLNVIKNFTTNEHCSAGGFYVTNKNKIYSFLEYGDNIAKISLPDTSLIYLENNKIKVSELVIDNMVSIKEYYTNLDKTSQLAAVTAYEGLLIQYMVNPDKDIQLAAVEANGRAIQYIINPDKEVQLAAVKQDGLAIQYIINPDKTIQWEAIKKNVYATKFITPFLI